MLSLARSFPGMLIGCLGLDVEQYNTRRTSENTSNLEMYLRFMAVIFLKVTKKDRELFLKNKGRNHTGSALHSL
jgi:hypothetical protein